MTDEGRTISAYAKSKVLFAQGEPADSVFYINSGKVKVSFLSAQAKEAIVAILGADEFCGEGCLAGEVRRMATATAMTECEIMRVSKKALVRVCTMSRRFPKCSLRTSWRGRSELKRIWSINCLIRARNVLRALFCYWRIR